MGIELDLDHASIEPADLPDPVAACSETQERFGIACPARLTESILRIYNEDFDLPAMYEGAGARRVGRIKVPEEGETARYLLRRGSEILVDAPISTITEGIRYQREAQAAASKTSASALSGEAGERGAELLELLASPALCSRRALFQHFDSEVKASTVLRPGEADAGVVAPIAESAVGMATSVDGNHRYCRLDPYLGAAYAVVEAARNVACVGASPAAITDCLNFGSPESPEVFHSFVESVRGIGDACRGLGRLEAPGDPLPVISGNVSFYNQSASGRAVAPSPIICCVGIVPDSSVCRSLSFKEAGNLIYRIGGHQSELGGSVYAEFVDPAWRGALPALDFPTVRREIELVVKLIRENKLHAVHDVSEGGTLVALAEMALGPESLGRRGLRANLSCACREVGESAALFGEAGGFLVEIRPQDAGLLEGHAQAHGLPCVVLGEVTYEREFVVEGLSRPLSLSVDELRRARESTMPRLLSREEL
jgi:phosphoribosylformylglycinamidine synthase